MDASHKPGIRSTAPTSFAKRLKAVFARLGSHKPARGSLKGTPKAPAVATKARSASPSASAPGTTTKPAEGRAARDEDGEEEPLDDGPLAVARQRERARCQAIIGCEAAAKNRALAYSLAFTTRMTRTEAIAMLELAPPSPEPDRYNQARADRNPRVGTPSSEAPPAREAAASRMHATLAAEMQRTRVAGPVASPRAAA